eukprot:TRINITY_DN8583_c0_g1_i2.p1 TRINITY_DN8583_c0_g1~~TRINITY_DN8583_c0_g1_i2.p1  ORF type:complete len:680 (-),score=259.14 TRINITY_DN8583_c0_g1_i2:23-2062(-)
MRHSLACWWLLQLSCTGVVRAFLHSSSTGSSGRAPPGTARAASGSSNPSAAELCQAGRACIAAGDLTSGFDHLAAAFALDAFAPGIKKGFEEYYLASIAANPQDLDAVEGLAVLYQDSGNYTQAAELFRRCMDMQTAPGGRADWWFASLLNCRAAVCDWRAWEEDAAQLRGLVRRGDVRDGDMPVIHPFDALSRPLTAADNRVIATQYARSVSARMAAEEAAAAHTRSLEAPPPPQPSRSRERAAQTPPPPQPQRRIRIAYVTGDLMGTHPLTHLMQSVFGLHDAARFEVRVYALCADDGSRERSHVRANVEHGGGALVDLSALPAHAAAAALRGDACDVAINLNGYAGTVKSAEIFALRPAPLCVSYMGFPGTMGADWVDYLLADETVVPRHLRAHVSERLLAMPHCYFVNDYRPLGLPDDAIVVCNFNRLHKLDPVTFAQWMELLREVPRAVLWLLDGGAAARENLHRAAEAAGVDPARVIFAPLAPRGAHLRRLRAADAFADSHPYSAHTVGCDALWAGVPIVTLAGDTMASRVAASLLETAGLGELVAETRAEYFLKLRRLCVDAAALARAKEGAARAREASPLFDTRAWVADMERGLERIVELQRSGYAPQDVYIRELPGGEEGDGGAECVREGYRSETSPAHVFIADAQRAQEGGGAGGDDGVVEDRETAALQ